MNYHAIVILNKINLHGSVNKKIDCRLVLNSRFFIPYSEMPYTPRRIYVEEIMSGIQERNRVFGVSAWKCIMGGQKGYYIKVNFDGVKRII